MTRLGNPFHRVPFTRLCQTEGIGDATTDDPKRNENHEQALDLAEEAVDELAKGNDEAADALIEASRKLDPDAVEEVARDLEEGAGDPTAVEQIEE